MGNKNKLLSILTVLIANPAYAAMDCNTQPSCTTLGYSKSNVADCAPDGYIYCPFDTSYKKCVSNIIKCPGNDTSCTHKIKCTNGKCQVVYYNCEDAGYFSKNNACSDTIIITLRDGTTKTCYNGCSYDSTTSCNSAGYDSPGSCSDHSLDWINVIVPTSVGDLNCEMCVGSDYKTSELPQVDTITIASLDEKTCQKKYVNNLENDINENDCIVYI